MGCGRFDRNNFHSSETRVAPESILRVLDAYKKVQPNFLKHEKVFFL